MEREEVADLFGVSPKHMHRCEFESNENLLIKGWICKHRGSQMGSIMIESVDETETMQYVTGMPKINYITTRDEIKDPYIIAKEDGTNIVHAPIIVEGDVVDTFFKTRLMPQVQPRWMVLLNDVVTKNHYKAVRKEKKSISYELFGYRNNHEVNYYDRGIELELQAIGMFDQGKAINYLTMYQTLCEDYGIEPLPNCFIILEKDGFIKAYPTSYMEDLGYEDDIIISDTYYDLYRRLEQVFEKINKDYQDNKGKGILTEGAVWHYGEEETHMIKCKAMSVREGHIKQACGIPHEIIKKALQKADENLGLKETDRKKVLEFVKAELLEEYGKEMVEDPRVKNKTYSILGNMTREMIVTEEIMEIIEKIHNEVGVDVNPADKMRCFAQLYPDQATLSRKVYQAIVSM